MFGDYWLPPVLTHELFSRYKPYRPSRKDGITSRVKWFNGNRDEAKRPPHNTPVTDPGALPARQTTAHVPG